MIYEDIIDNDPYIHGLYCPNESLIKIKKGLTKEKTRITLYHEVLHAIFDKLGFDSEYENEKLIKSLSTVWWVFEKENF